MRISELVAHLEALRAEHGDLEVRAYAYGDIDPYPATARVERPRQGPAFVLVEDGPLPGAATLTLTPTGSGPGEARETRTHPVATANFAFNTEPHVATVGGTPFEFQPEVMGDEFLDAYEEFRDGQKEETGVDVENLDGADAQQLRKITRALRVFLARLMLPDSAEFFLRLEVVRGAEVLETFTDLEEAQAYAEKAGDGARVQNAFRCPDRILIQLLDWVVGLYSGGRRPPTSSTGSATTPSRAGRRGTGTSRSRG